MSEEGTKRMSLVLLSSVGNLEKGKREGRLVGLVFSFDDEGVGNFLEGKRALLLGSSYGQKEKRRTKRESRLSARGLGHIKKTKEREGTWLAFCAKKEERFS